MKSLDNITTSDLSLTLLRFVKKLQYLVLNSKVLPNLQFYTKANELGPFLPARTAT